MRAGVHTNSVSMNESTPLLTCPSAAHCVVSEAPSSLFEVRARSPPVPGRNGHLATPLCAPDATWRRAGGPGTPRPHHAVDGCWENSERSAGSFSTRSQPTTRFKKMIELNYVYLLFLSLTKLNQNSCSRLNSTQTFSWCQNVIFDVVVVVSGEGGLVTADWMTPSVLQHGNKSPKIDCFTQVGAQQKTDLKSAKPQTQEVCHPRQIWEEQANFASCYLPNTHTHTQTAPPDKQQQQQSGFPSSSCWFSQLYQPKRKPN